MSDRQRVRPRVVLYFKVSELKRTAKPKNAAISRICELSIGVMTFLLLFPTDSKCFTGSSSPRKFSITRLLKMATISSGVSEEFQIVLLFGSLGSL